MGMKCSHGGRPSGCTACHAAYREMYERIVGAQRLVEEARGSLARDRADVERLSREDGVPVVGVFELRPQTVKERREYERFCVEETFRRVRGER